MRIGAHVSDNDPVGLATQRNAEVVQFFLTDPQDWKALRPQPQAAQLRSTDLEVYLHSPYVIKMWHR